MENKENIWGVWALCQAKRLSYFLRFFWVSLENFLVVFLFLLFLQPNFLIKRFLIKKKTCISIAIAWSSSSLSFLVSILPFSVSSLTTSSSGSSSSPRARATSKMISLSLEIQKRLNIFIHVSSAAWFQCLWGEFANSWHKIGLFDMQKTTSPLARMILAIPASSIKSKRHFWPVVTLWRRKEPGWLQIR